MLYSPLCWAFLMSTAYSPGPAGVAGVAAPPVQPSTCGSRPALLGRPPTGMGRLGLMSRSHERHLNLSARPFSPSSIASMRRLYASSASCTASSLALATSSFPALPSRSFLSLVTSSPLTPGAAGAGAICGLAMAAPPAEASPETKACITDFPPTFFRRACSSIARPSIWAASPGAMYAAADTPPRSSRSAAMASLSSSMPSSCCRRCASAASMRCSIIFMSSPRSPRCLFWLPRPATTSADGPPLRRPAAKFLRSSAIWTSTFPNFSSASPPSVGGGPATPANPPVAAPPDALRPEGGRELDGWDAFAEGGRGTGELYPEESFES
mmetsp:Transcript_64598/g.203904  ORF Transcript_64598/g.203904 Transcript_64598/m.203904 type:complete len:326 (-) Transcript_64598:152-1129(-)